MRALLLLSGGLDSVLAARLLQEQGLEVVGVCFTSPFFGCEEAARAAVKLGAELLVEDLSGEILEILRDPPAPVSGRT